MHFKTTESIREEMVGKKYESHTGQVVICLNVVRAGGGHQVILTMAPSTMYFARLEDSERDTHSRSKKINHDHAIIPSMRWDFLW